MTIHKVSKIQYCLKEEEDLVVIVKIVEKIINSKILKSLITVNLQQKNRKSGIK